MNNSKINYTALRAFEMLKMLYQGSFSQEEILEHLSQLDNNEQLLRADSLYKYINTFKLFSIDTERKQGRYSIKNSPFPQTFSKEEIDGLKLFFAYSKMVLPNNLHKEIEAIIENICKSSDNCPYEDIIASFQTTKNNYKRLLSKDLNTESFEKYKILCEQKLKISFNYNNKSLGTIQTFIVEPLDAEITPTGVILKAYNPTVAENQLFHVNYISDLKQLPQVTKPINVKSSVTFKLKGRLASSYDLKAGERITDIGLNNEYKVITNSEEDKDILLKRLLRYGKACEIIYPKSFRTKAKATIEQIKTLYQ